MTEVIAGAGIVLASNAIMEGLAGVGHSLSQEMWSGRTIAFDRGRWRRVAFMAGGEIGRG